MMDSGQTISELAASVDEALKERQQADDMLEGPRERVRVAQRELWLAVLSRFAQGTPARVLLAELYPDRARIPADYEHLATQMAWAIREQIWEEGR
jgi:hypothetical protein